ncbi:MAG: BtrH N-terminal domain-containing protein [Myxococcota bacterium]|jgi:hypothetical protein|nr:BtrH N-terminal domain-containing protein [Myxococcota bacterium]
MTRTLIENYRNHPGEHCGSVAMRGLLEHYCGLELPEPAVFGLSAGIASGVLEMPGVQPGIMLAGRTMALESGLADILQVDYREQPDPDDDHAWQVVREEVLAGRPTMLSGDILYLDYREYKVHFPGHRFVLLGFDDEIEKAYLADRINVEPELCSYGALRESRNPPEGMSTQNLWGRFHGSEVGRDMREAISLALERASSAMLQPETTAPASLEGSEGAPKMQSGVEAVDQLVLDLPGWAKRSDAVEVAAFNASCVEKFGNGGGFFRRLYAGFLDWARDLHPDLVPEGMGDLARQAADGWTAMSTELYHAAKEDAPQARFDAAAREVATVARVERQLFETLAGA